MGLCGNLFDERQSIQSRVPMIVAPYVGSLLCMGVSIWGIVNSESFDYQLAQIVAFASSLTFFSNTLLCDFTRRLYENQIFSNVFMTILNVMAQFIVSDKKMDHLALPMAAASLVLNVIFLPFSVVQYRKYSRSTCTLWASSNVEVDSLFRQDCNQQMAVQDASEDEGTASVGMLVGSSAPVAAQDIRRRVTVSV